MKWDRKGCSVQTDSTPLMAEPGLPPVSPLIPGEELRKRIQEMGEEISRDYNGQSLLVVGALKGSFVFLADLIRHISLPVRIEFLHLTPYGEGSEGGIRILKETDLNLRGENVLFVDDVIDSGLTVNFVMDRLSLKNPRSLHLASLLLKKGKGHLRYPVRYQGFEIDDRFVVGFGMDRNGYYRNLDFVGFD